MSFWQTQPRPWYSWPSHRLCLTNFFNDFKTASKTFGFHEDWLSEYFSDPESFWDINSLGTAQVDGFKMWLKHAEIDSKYQAAYNIQTEEDGAWRVFIANDRVIEDFDGNILARKAVKDKYQAKMLRKEARMLCRLHHIEPRPSRQGAAPFYGTLPQAF